jgi:hypothetical protein
MFNGKQESRQAGRGRGREKNLGPPSRGLLVSNPYTTTNPEPIPARLINTCKRVNVNVVIPRIMMNSFQEAGAEVLWSGPSQEV